MNPLEDSEGINKKELYKLRKKKIKDEIIAARKILEQDVEPIEVADVFIATSIKLMQEGLSQRFPNLSREQLSERARKNLSIYQKIQSLRERRGYNG
jgi:hypothetical protein